MNDNRLVRTILVLTVAAAIAILSGLPTAVVHALQTRAIGTTVGGVVGSTATATALNVDASGNLQIEADLLSANGTTLDTNNGTASAGSIRVAVASDNTAFKVRSTPAMSGYVTDYLSVTTALPSTSQTLTTTTTLLQHLRCNNLTGAAQTYQITDGNDAYIVGPAHSLAANTFETVVEAANGIEVASGIKYSATNASAVRCQFSGKQ